MCLRPPPPHPLTRPPLSNRTGDHVKITINRRKATQHRLDPSKDPSAKNSLFGQIHSLLAPKPPAFFRTSKRLWSVVFAGEGADDVGGPYRESLAGLCAELMSAATPLFLPSPNQRHNIGDQRDKFILNPAARRPLHMSMYQFLGRLMGGCVRGGEPLPLYISSLVWKRLVGDPIGQVRVPGGRERGGGREGGGAFPTSQLPNFPTDLLRKAPRVVFGP